MGKTIKGKKKIAAKKAALARKVARKCKGGKITHAAFLALLCGFSSLWCGCSTTGAQPSRAIHQTNTFRDCRITINAAKVDGETSPVEMWTCTQANEGSETVSPTATPTNSTSIPITVKYNDAIAGASTASRTVLGTIGDGLSAVLSLMQSGETGTVAVKTLDGKDATVKCEGGQCSYCPDGNCEYTGE